MNCSQCGSELPLEAAYCPVCGAPRREIDHLITQVRHAADQTIEATLAVFNRASKELEPAFDKVFQTLQPVVQDVGKALQPLADSTVRAANEVADALRPTARKTEQVAREVAGKTVATFRPVLVKATQKTGAAVRRVRDAARRFG